LAGDASSSVGVDLAAASSGVTDLMDGARPHMGSASALVRGGEGVLRLVVSHEL